MIPLLITVAFGLFLHKIRSDHKDIDARVAEGKAALAANPEAFSTRTVTLPDVATAFPSPTSGNATTEQVQSVKPQLQETSQESMYSEELA